MKSTKELNVIINDLKVAFLLKDSLYYWIKAIGRIENLTDSEKGYIIYNLNCSI